LALGIGLPLGLFMAGFSVLRGMARPLFEPDRTDPAHRLDPVDHILVRHRHWGKVFIIGSAGSSPA